jgi:hypothetical protein
MALERFRLTIVITSHLLCLGLTFAAEHATVTFKSVNSLGLELPFKVTEFRSGGGAPDLSSTFRNLKGENIPFGTYKYSLMRSDVNGIAQVHVGTVLVNAAFYPYNGM